MMTKKDKNNKERKLWVLITLICFSISLWINLGLVISTILFIVFNKFESYWNLLDFFLTVFMFLAGITLTLSLFFRGDIVKKYGILGNFKQVLNPWRLHLNLKEVIDNKR